jgi:hypothetical protein
VRAFRTADGGLDIEAYQWATGEFAREMLLGTQIFMGGTDIDEISAAEFDTAVAALRKERG